MIILKTYWVRELGGEEGYDKALMNGVSEPPAASIGGGTFNGSATGAASSAVSSAKKGGKYELVLYQKPIPGDGRQANNPWLLETPDPITRAYLGQLCDYFSCTWKRIAGR